MSDRRKAKAGVAHQLRERERLNQQFKKLSHKVKNKEELTKEEIQQFNEMTKNSKMEKALQTNEWIIDSLIREKFEDPMYYDVFVARSRDIGEPITVEKAKYFKEEINSLNKGNSKNINCFSLKLGINAIVSLCKHARTRKLDSINIADNAIADSGMHAVKGLIAANCCKSLNLASNMISENGLNMVIEDFTLNTTLEVLDIGIWKKSIRKNSIGYIGAKCLAAMLIHNRTLNTLKMQDNDIGIKGADIISQALKQNKSLAHLKISENNIQTEGAEQIIKSNFSLHSLDLSKNNITAKIGTTLQYFISNSFKLQVLNLEHNNLQLKGVEFLTSVLPDVLPKSNLRLIDISRNVLEDETIIMLADLYKSEERMRLESLIISSCHITDVGLLYFMEAIESVERLRSIILRDNFISEACEKLLLELIDKNSFLKEFDLKGNRISMSCMSRISSKLKKNVHSMEVKEPNLLKNEIYRLNFEKEKVTAAAADTEKMKGEIIKLEAERLNMEADLNRCKDNEEKLRAQIESKIEVQEQQNIRKRKEIDNKKADFQELIDQQEQYFLVVKEKTKGRKSYNLEIELRKEKYIKDLQDLEIKTQASIAHNNTELEALRKDLEDLRNKHKEVKEKQSITLKKTQDLIESNL